MTKPAFLSGGWGVIVPSTAAIGVYLFFVFLPQMREIHRLRQEIAEKQSFLGTVAQRAVLETSVEADIDATRKYIDRFRGASSNSTEVSGLFAKLSELLKSSQVTTAMFKPEQKTALASIDRIPLTIGVTGKLHHLKALLANIEQVNERIWVDEVLIERGKEAGEEMECELKLAIFTNHFEISD